MSVLSTLQIRVAIEFEHYICMYVFMYVYALDDGQKRKKIKLKFMQGSWVLNSANPRQSGAYALKFAWTPTHFLAWYASVLLRGGIRPPPRTISGKFTPLVGRQSDLCVCVCVCVRARACIHLWAGGRAGERGRARLRKTCVRATRQRAIAMGLSAESV